MLQHQYYASRLTDTELDIYKALHNGIVDVSPKISVDCTAPTEAQIKRIFTALHLDHPQFYFLDQTSLRYTIFTDTTVFYPQYFMTADEVQRTHRQMEQQVHQLFQLLRPMHRSDLEKEYLFHDYFCRYITYDRTASDTIDPKHLMASHSIYGVFLNKQAVCDGISKAFKLLMNAADVPCIVVEGETKQLGHRAHAWNIVPIEQHNYHIDVTWDLADTKEYPISYDYFNLTDAAIARDHTQFFNTPRCNAITANHFVNRGLRFPSMQTLYQHVARRIANNDESFYFQLPNSLQFKAETKSLLQAISGLPNLHRPCYLNLSINEAQKIGRIQLSHDVT